MRVNGSAGPNVTICPFSFVLFVVILCKYNNNNNSNVVTKNYKFYSNGESDVGLSWRRPDVPR
jgi:hypothetical protein